MKIEDFACSAPSTAGLASLERCMFEVDLHAPIDFYLKGSREIILYGTDDRLHEMQKLGGLLLLGLISAAEGFFRSILSTTLDICPISRTAAAEKQINLGGVLWHGKEEIRRSAFEHMSFTSGREIKSASKGYLDFNVTDDIFSGILKDFESICHLRHGLIHNAGILPGRNAVQIDIKPYKKPVEIRIDYAFLQAAAASIDSLVFTFNRALFSELCGRWAVKWRNRSDWLPAEERKNFLPIWKAFICKTELEHRHGKSNITLSKCIDKIKTEYNL